MGTQQPAPQPSALPCIFQPCDTCQQCAARGKLMCHFDRADMLHFFMIILPFGVTSIGGMIQGGNSRFLWLWLAYALFFFFVWEARVLCSHCPYWAEEGRILRCHANYGVFKIWSYDPRPMSRFDQAQFILGAFLLLAFPFPFLLLGGQYFPALIGLSAAVSGVFIMRKNVCSRCIHFSCPVNTAPQHLVDAFLERNPVIKEAWEDQKNIPDV